MNFFVGVPGFLIYQISAWERTLFNVITEHKGKGKLTYADAT